LKKSDPEEANIATKKLYFLIGPQKEGAHPVGGQSQRPVADAPAPGRGPAAGADSQTTREPASPTLGLLAWQIPRPGPQTTTPDPLAAGITKHDIDAAANRLDFAHTNS